MEIILVSNKQACARRLSIRYKGVYCIALLLLVIMTTSFYIGIHFTQSKLEEKHYALYLEKEKKWQNEFKKQQNNANTDKQKTKQSLDTLYAKLSTLQAHLLRLDVLGSRLVEIANISDIEFNMLHPPGLGGPEISNINNTLYATNFIDELHITDQKVKDSNEKLFAIESLISATNLQSQTFPKGNFMQNSWLSSPFGWRTDPISGKKEFHRGVDLVAKVGTNIVSVADGIVTWAGRHPEYGNMLEINHGNNYITRYAHNKKNLVTVGEKILKNQIIAIIGSTGRSTGLHVHFEVLYNGKNLDPKKFITDN